MSESTYELTADARRTWTQQLQCSRRKRGVKGAGIGSIDPSGVSRFENGDPATLRRWFEGTQAAEYEWAIGEEPGTLLRWLEEARSGKVVADPWHASFPGISADEAFLSPSFEIRDGQLGSSQPTDFEGLVSALKAHEGRLRLHIPAVPGVGRSTFITKLQAAGLPSSVSIADRPRSSGGAWRSVRGVEEHPEEKAVELSLLPWGHASIRALAERLLSLGEVNADQQARITRLAESLQEQRITLSPGTAISLAAEAAAGRVPGGAPLVGVIARAEWARVGHHHPGLEGLDERVLLEFWADRRLACPGDQWVSPLRSEAIHLVERILARRDNRALEATAPSLLSLRHNLNKLSGSKGNERKRLEEELLKQVSRVEAADLVGAWVRSEAVREVGDRLEANDPSLVERFAVAGLRGRMADIAGDEHLAWALDPTWRRLLLELGRQGADPRPLIDRWLSLPPSIQADAALPLLFLLSERGSEGWAVSAEEVRTIQAVALALLLRDPPDIRPALLILRSGNSEELCRVFIRYSDRWSVELGYFGSDPLQNLWARLPPGLLDALPAGRIAHDPMSLLLTTLEGQEDIATWLCQWSPFQVPPLSTGQWEAWKKMEHRTLGSTRPSATQVLERAAENGLNEALWKLTGEAEERIDQHFDIAMRMKWLPRAADEDLKVNRLSAFIQYRLPDGGDRPHLVELARRLGANLVERAMLPLLLSKAREGADPSRQPTWATDRPENARLVLDMAHASGSNRLVEALDDRIRVYLGDLRPRCRTREWESARIAWTWPSKPAAERASKLIATPSPSHSRDAQELQVSLLGALLEWEELRHAAALALAEQGRPEHLRARLTDDWTWPDGARLAFDLDMLRVELQRPATPPTFFRLLRNPVPSAEGGQYLRRLRGKGMEMASTRPIPDDGTFFPTEALVLDGPPLGAFTIPWLSQRHQELELLQDLGEPSRSALKRSLCVLGWFLGRNSGGPELGWRELPPDLLLWLRSLACWHEEYSPTEAILVLLGREVRRSAARALITRRDLPTLSRLWARDELESVHGELEAEAEAALSTDPAFRKAVWQQCPSSWTRSRAWHAAEGAGCTERWFTAERERRQQAEHQEASTETDLQTRMGWALLSPTPLSGEEIDQVALEWAAQTELMSLPWRGSWASEPRTIGLVELLELLGRRQHEGSVALFPILRQLWEGLLSVPLIPASQAKPLHPGKGLPAWSYPPEPWEAVVALLRQTSPGMELLCAAWGRADEGTVETDGELLSRWNLGWADFEDVGASFRRQDVHRCWLFRVIADHLSAAELDPAQALPGLLRVQLRLWGMARDPAALERWAQIRLSDPSPDDLIECAPLWSAWAHVRPAQAWQWIQEAWERGAPGVVNLELLMELAFQQVEHVAPGARRWWAERRTALAERFRPASPPPSSAADGPG